MGATSPHARGTHLAVVALTLLGVGAVALSFLLRGDEAVAGARLAAGAMFLAALVVTLASARRAVG